jgi:hypothetical protein
VLLGSAMVAAGCSQGITVSSPSPTGVPRSPK